ncbi:MAG: energy-coupling factor transporter transmembrane component T [Smithella sp.]|nr:energy-coupling factor transporter transmembrane component T [Smithella sp.]
MMYHTGSFVKGSSLFHNLDPRLKLATTVCFSVLILWVKPPLALFMGLAVLLAALVSGIRWRTIAAAFKPLLFFILLIFFVHVFFGEKDSEPLMQIPVLGWHWSPAGLREAFFVVWRFLSLIIAAVLLTMTTAPSHMIAAIKYFLRPLKLVRVPVDDIAFMISLALRFMPFLLAEKERIDIAQKARGYHLSGAGIAPRIKSFLFLTLNVLLGVFRRADELSLAMEARNYQRGPRASFTELKFVSVDYLAAILLLFSLFIFVAFNLRLS